MLAVDHSYRIKLAINIHKSFKTNNGNYRVFFVVQGVVQKQLTS
jgi:hypothetical protein